MKGNIMFGFMVGLIWFLILIGDESSIGAATVQVSHYLYWWYLVTSFFVFANLFASRNVAVAEEMLKRFMKVGLPPQEMFKMLMIGFVASRFLLFYGLHFLTVSVMIDGGVKTTQFVVGAIMLCLGTLFSAPLLLPSVTLNVLHREQYE